MLKSRTRLFNLYLGFFLLFALYFVPAYAVDSACIPKNLAGPYQVLKVFDGDTIRVKIDSKELKLRLAGVQAPETGVSYSREIGKEPYSGLATKLLKNLIKASNDKVYIDFSKQKKDKYDRLLGHIYSLNKTNLQKLLLKEGVVMKMNFSPNSYHEKCYYDAELEARNFGHNMWSLFESYPFEDFIGLKKKRGHRIIVADFKKVTKLKKGTIKLALYNSKVGKINAYISKKYAQFVNLEDMQDLQGNKIELRGFVYRSDKGKYSMQISSSFNIKKL